MSNPWEGISLNDYENHMSLDSVKQLQIMNSIMKEQFEDYPVSTAMVLGVAGGNGLEHVSRDKYRTVYGVDIIERIQKNVEEITGQVEINANKLAEQNEQFKTVFGDISEMTTMLNDSVNAIEEMNEAHKRQSEIIKKTVEINKNIAESIRSENEQFVAISTMAGNNATNTEHVAQQASAINDMVDEINRLLNN